MSVKKGSGKIDLSLLPTGSSHINLIFLVYELNASGDNNSSFIVGSRIHRQGQIGRISKVLFDHNTGISSTNDTTQYIVNVFSTLTEPFQAKHHICL
jgi:hypothetical protein